MKKVLLAMSGGVDSTVTAALLLEAGYEVSGITMDIWGTGASLSLQEKKIREELIEDAAQMAGRFGISHQVVDVKNKFDSCVIDYFTEAYAKGDTPNPCIQCNKHLKFSLLWREKERLQADYLATGHYARIQKVADRFWLKKARDLQKDQSYVLYNLLESQLAELLFPLGEYTKEMVRQKAEQLGLAVAQKPESQEICFILDDDYRRFLRERSGKTVARGDFVDVEGKFLGKHEGLPFYTIGQRKGLGLPLGYPAYVVRFDNAKNQIIVGKKEDLLVKKIQVREMNILEENFGQDSKLVLEAKIRYNSQPVKVCIQSYAREEKRARILFLEPVLAAAPGQAVVFYDQDRVLGGGTIDAIKNEVEMEAKYD